MGRAALAIAGMALIGIGVAIGVGWWWPSRADAEARLTQPIRTVRIDAVSSTVRIRTADGSATTVHEHFGYHGRSRPGDTFRVEGDQLVLPPCGNSCSTDYDVTVPRGTAVTGSTTSGVIRLQGTGPVDVSATSGDVDVTLTDPQNVRVRTTSGAIRLFVPHDRYQVTGDSTSGERRIDAATDPSSPHLLELTTTSGDVTVRER
ncbi:DUF4097 family beta strand repeat-containing protein [Amycolatopsis pigmentata]|uniref:DUF4097 family beta strand repeat-containing protein n=1 Tax=Amycolatopsis pigmentata TaxID=450801 RepID=A0ABW5FSN0_9PSEU